MVRKISVYQILDSEQSTNDESYHVLINVTGMEGSKLKNMYFLLVFLSRYYSFGHQTQLAGQIHKHTHVSYKVSRCWDIIVLTIRRANPACQHADCKIVGNYKPHHIWRPSPSPSPPPLESTAVALLCSVGVGVGVQRTSAVVVMRKR